MIEPYVIYDVNPPNNKKLAGNRLIPGFCFFG
jgi:hypothetical protein